MANAGSMRNLNMELEFRPATGIVTITLPYLPVFKIRAPEMVNFKWEVPSHPAVGEIGWRVRWVVSLMKYPEISRLSPAS